LALVQDAIAWRFGSHFRMLAPRSARPLARLNEAALVDWPTTTTTSTSMNRVTGDRHRKLVACYADTTSS